ncbi:nuclear transport factor 2 family protein [Streptomyces sp. NBC_00525]|uniref:nuclear transport factor 2 family protein n=1 Tax=Streptomyces sp. NBC_00525 TaxID=2903660 RepID=UPI002E8200B6|nr:nuclear transport factor 2 family protein [Streptomyces sp. NBC_00525]WUC96801.1 nuclear transport factor 2 family protein [Streptomyces sp. NBC_00525]
MHTDAWTTTAPHPADDLVTAAGTDHVRLVYDYLDAGDLDACASLLHEHVQLDLPGAPSAHGRTAFLRAHRDHLGAPARHEIDRVVARDRSVVVTGRRVGTGTGTDDTPARFVDFFRIAGDGMVESCTRYYHAEP